MVDHFRNDPRPAAEPGSSGEGLGDFEIVAMEGPLRDADADADADARTSPKVNQAIGMVSVQLDGSIADATTALTARAVTEHRSLDAVAGDVIDRRIVFPIREEPSAREGQTLPVEDWYAENRRQTEGAVDHEPIDADRWLYVHLGEVVGATSDAAVALILESGMVPRVTQDRSGRQGLDAGRISLLVDDVGTVQAAEWG